jgi:hypothetical protein
MERLITGNSDLNVKIVVVSLLKILNISRFHSYTKALIEWLILEKITLAGIAKATGIHSMASELCKKKVCRNFPINFGDEKTERSVDFTAR